jgi:hypothetical protein
LNFKDIAELLNFETGQNYGESSYRKEFAAFNRGRIYERKSNDKGIAIRILSISDLHAPFQKPIETYSEYVGRVDILQLNGDLVDMQAISKFSKAYRVSPMEEMILCRQYLIDLIEFIKPKRVIATYGNHETRFHLHQEFTSE